MIQCHNDEQIAFKLDILKFVVYVTGYHQKKANMINSKGYIVWNNTQEKETKSWLFSKW